MSENYVPPCEKGENCVVKLGHVSWSPSDGTIGPSCKYKLIGFPKNGLDGKCLWCFKYRNLPSTHFRDIPDDLK